MSLFTDSGVGVVFGVGSVVVIAVVAAGAGASSAEVLLELPAKALFMVVTTASASAAVLAVVVVVAALDLTPAPPATSSLASPASACESDDVKLRFTPSSSAFEKMSDCALRSPSGVAEKRLTLGVLRLR